MGGEENLLVKDHTHGFVNKGGEIGGMFFLYSLLLIIQYLSDIYIKVNWYFCENIQAFLLVNYRTRFPFHVWSPVARHTCISCDKSAEGTCMRDSIFFHNNLVLYLCHL